MVCPISASPSIVLIPPHLMCPIHRRQQTAARQKVASEEWREKSVLSLPL
jgi:hypothetical protein